MELLGDLLAGCAPGEPDCAAGTIPNGLSAWFVILVLSVAVLAGVALVALLARGASRRRRPGKVAA